MDAPAPLLFQRRFRTENRAISHGTLRKMLLAALGSTGLVDLTDGSPLNYTPHDFRRIFVTDAIMNGLPPHIAQIIAGHQDINVTLGYEKARELHQAGEKSQVARSARCPAGLPEFFSRSTDQAVCQDHPIWCKICPSEGMV